MNDDELLSSASGIGPDCLPPDLLEQIAAGAGTDAARRHVAACAYCKTEAALMRQFSIDKPTAAEAAHVQFIEQKLRSGGSKPAVAAGWWSTFFSSAWGRYAAAGVTAMLAVGVWLGTSSQVPEPIDRTTDSVRSSELDGVDPSGDLTQPPAVVKWHAASGAASYRLSIVDVDSKSIWQADSSRPEIRLPNSARALMANRKTLFWRVEALDSQGRPIGTSELQKFRVVSGSE